MSHIALFDKVPITSLTALAQAAEFLGLELLAAKTYEWYGVKVGNDPMPEGFTIADLGKCEYKLRLKTRPANSSRTPYEIGLVKRGNHYVMLYDYWCGGFGLLEKISTDGRAPDKLTQAYTLAQAAEDLSPLGTYETEYVEEDGQLRLEVYELA